MDPIDVESAYWLTIAAGRYPDPKGRAEAEETRRMIIKAMPDVRDQVRQRLRAESNNARQPGQDDAIQ